MAELTLAERLAAVRKRAEPVNQSPISDDLTPATLSLYLAIYQKANVACYIHYMEGAKALRDWLTSNGAVPLVIPVVTTPVPRLCTGYEVIELSSVLLNEKEFTSTTLKGRKGMLQSIFAEVTSNVNIR